MIDGKVPPQSVDIEEAVLGAMMLERDCFINNPVKPEWFYKDEHRKIIACIRELVNESVPIDLLQVTKRLRDKGQLEEIGGPLFVTRLTNKVASSIHISFHIRIIQQDYVRRELIRISQKMNQQCYDNSIDIDDIFSDLQNELSNVMSFGSDNSCSYKDATNELIEDLNSPLVTGMKTGFSKFDKFAGGFHDSDLIIIAGETSMGKTSLAITAVKHCAKHCNSCAVFSLEMTKKQLVARITAQDTGISSKKIMYNNLNRDEKSLVIDKLKQMQNLPIYFDETSTNDIDKICTSIRKLKIKYDISLVLVDYIQDMKGSDTESGIAEIGRKLKNIAKELNIPVIAISQLARDRNNPKPTISRLRGSGQLEEKADIIMLLYRPEYYGKTYDEPFENVPPEGTAQVDIAKGRNVGIGSFILTFNKESTNFYDYEAERDYGEFIQSIQKNEEVNHPDSRIAPNDNFDKEDTPF